MENATEYLVKVNGLLVLFFVVYYIFLRKETFFQYNRWFLNIGLVASLLLPFAIIKKIVWVEKASEATTFVSLPYANLQNMSIPVSEDVFVSYWNLSHIVIYFVGLSILFFKLCQEYYAYRQILKNKKSVNCDGIKTIEITENVGPFSFFNTIVINPNLYSESELNAIISHEKVHVRQYHSVDVLVSKLFAIVFWYNPIVWLYRKFMIQNLEYIADNKAIENDNNFKQYQYTLLKHTTNMSCVALTNPFYQSLIKKRIVMLNKKPSTRANRLKLAIVVPMLAIFVWQFQTKIVAQEKVSAKESIAETPKIEIEINKNTTAEFMAEYSERLKREFNIDLKFSKIKRNKKGELTAIKVSLNDNKGSETEHDIESDKAIEKFLIVYDKNNGKSEIGFYAKKNQNSKGIALTSADDVVTATAYEIPSATTVEIPEPPTPPMPPIATAPTAPNLNAYQEMLKNMPKPPTPTQNMRNKSAMERFEKSMQAYENKMVDYEKNIDEKQKIADVDMEKFDKQIKAYDDVMRDYDSKMKEYENQMNAYNSEMQNTYSESDSINSNVNARFVKIGATKNNDRKRIIEERKKMISERKKIINERRKIVHEKRKSISE